MPQAVKRSHSTVSTSCAMGADRAPSMSQSITDFAAGDCGCTALSISLAVFGRHRGEKTVVLQRIDQAGIDIVADILAVTRKELKHILHALHRRLEILRRLYFE